MSDLRKAGKGIMGALAKATELARAEKAALKVKPPSDNIATVTNSNFYYPKHIGNQTLKVNDVSGGVRMSDPYERKRVEALAQKMSGPNGYISRIIVDHNNNVIEGQHRLEALRHLGIEDVPVYKIEDLSDTMPVAKMEEALNAVGPIHPDHAGQLVGYALEGIAEHGLEKAREMNYGKYQKFYEAALDAAMPEVGKSDGGKITRGLMGALAKAKTMAQAERDANRTEFLEGSAAQKRLYHGTGSDIQEFDKSKIKRPMFGEGFHLAESPALASFYAGQFKEGQNVMPVHAAIKKPFELKDMSKWYDIPGNTDAEKTAWIKSQGYDGIKYNHGAPYNAPNESGTGWVAFEPNQIKSATGNRGTYDRSQNDITKADGGKIVKGMMGALAKARAMAKAAPQEEALALAQKRAALPPSQGGLGLPANNTPMQRARAMEWNTPGFHATNADIKKFDPNLYGASDYGSIGQGVYIDPSKNAGYANLVASIVGKDKSANVMPLLVREGNVFNADQLPLITNAKTSKEISKNLKRLGYDSVMSEVNGQPNEMVVFDPDRVRSRFAAFDPFRKDAATAALMGVIAPDLLAEEVEEKHKAKGGVLHMADAGKVTRKVMGALAKATDMAKAEQKTLTAADDSYRGSHKAPGPDFGAPLHDVSSGGMYPSDFYGPNGRQYYGSEGWDFDASTYNKILNAKNKPDAIVNIFRAIPRSVYDEAMKTEAPLQQMIRPGDWVTLSNDYAKSHGEKVLNNDYKVVRKRVPAKEVWTNADSIHEWGYHPDTPKAKGGVIHMADAGRVTKGIMGALTKARELAKAEATAAKAIKGAQDILPAAERNANLAKFLEKSAEKRRMYHGSREPNIKEFKTRKDLTDESGMTGHYADERDAVFLAPEPEFTTHFSKEGYIDTHQAPTTYPVYVQVENPFDFDNPEHLKRVKETYLDMYHNPESDLYDPHLLPSERSMAQHRFNKKVDALQEDENNWPKIENAEFQEVLKDLGFDSFYTRERGSKNLGVYDPSRIKSALGNRGTYDMGEPDINKAKGGSVGSAIEKISSALTKAKEMARAEKAAQALAEADPAVETLVKAAERAAAGRKAADVNKATSPMKMSEALGNMNLEGKGKLRVTQSDRTRVGGGNIGGAHFSGLQQVDPLYENAAWGVGKKGTATGMINLSDPNTLWTTVLGGADQLKSNPLVFNKLRKGFTEAMKEGKLSDELASKINQNLALKFGEGADIRDPKIWQYADTFDKRALLADQMLGQGANPKEGGIPLGGEKSGKGVIFRPSDILKQETEPALLHPEHGGTVPSFAVGPRLFSLSGEVKERPDLHPGFPFILQGEDKGVVFDPVEGTFAMPDFTNELLRKYGKGPGFFEWTKGKKDKSTGETLTPVQEITEEYLTYLQKAGKKEGGSVNKPKKPHWYDDFHRKMAQGGVVFTDKDAVDNFLMVRHKAEGGDADDVSVKDIARNLGKLAKEQGKEELSSLKKPRAVLDIGNRGILAPALGSPVDLINMGLGGIDALTAMTANPTRLASEKPIGGQEHIKELMDSFGITSGEDRPMIETTLSFFSPTGMIKGAQKSGELAKKLPGFVRKIESGLASMSKKP